MNRPAYIPADYSRIKVVGSLREVFNTPFGGPDEVNCVLFPRSLTGEFHAAAQRADFNALARDLDVLAPSGNFSGGWCGLTLHSLKTIAQELKNHASAAAAALVADDMNRIGGLPYLRVIRAAGYTGAGTDVHNFHADGGTRLLCAYNDPLTEFLRQEDAVSSGNGWEMREGSRIYRFAAGDLWRQAGEEDHVSPFLHRAPLSKPGDAPRLLLVRDR